MSRINTNVSSLIAVNTLNKNNNALQTSLERLSTGTRINSGKDDPAGLIASENLKAEQTATQTAIGNAQRADNIIGTAEGALSEVSNLLVSLQGLVNQSANSSGLSQDEKDANQLQVDSILSTVNRISNSASFEGVKLLNGTFDYTTSGVAASSLTSVQINSANVPVGGSVNVVVQVTQSAETGQLNYLGSGSGLTSATTLSITGNLGTQQVSFSSGTKSSAVVAGINQFTDSTGVKATLSGNAIKITSSSFGSTQFVSVTSTGTSFASSTKNVSGTVATSSYGRDATLKINGASATSSGLDVRAVSSNLDINLTLSSAFNTNNASKTFAITGGGATFELGAQVNTANLASIGISTVDTAHLGQTLDSNSKSVSLADLGSGKEAALNVSNANTTLAQNIVSAAIKQVSTLRGRLGAFQSNVLASTENSLNVALENVSASESAIADTDFATETSNLTRSQILVQSATSVLQQANSAPQSVLKLLG